MLGAGLEIHCFSSLENLGWLFALARCVICQRLNCALAAKEAGLPAPKLLF